MHEFEFCPQKPETCRYAQLLRLFIESGSQGRCERSVRHNVSQPSAWHSGIQIFGSKIAKDYSTLYTLSNLCLAKLLLALCSFIWIDLSRYHKAALHACMQRPCLHAGGPRGHWLMGLGCISFLWSILHPCLSDKSNLLLAFSLHLYPSFFPLQHETSLSQWLPV